MFISLHFILMASYISFTTQNIYVLSYYHIELDKCSDSSFIRHNCTAIWIFVEPLVHLFALVIHNNVIIANSTMSTSLWLSAPCNRVCVCPSKLCYWFLLLNNTLYLSRDIIDLSILFFINWKFLVCLV